MLLGPLARPLGAGFVEHLRWPYADRESFVDTVIEDCGVRPDILMLQDKAERLHLKFFRVLEHREPRDTRAKWS